MRSSGDLYSLTTEDVKIIRNKNELANLSAFKASLASGNMEEILYSRFNVGSDESIRHSHNKKNYDAGVEFVTPILIMKNIDKIDHLCNVINNATYKSKKLVTAASKQCSVHVHMGMQKYIEERQVDNGVVYEMLEPIKKIIYNWMYFEKVLFQLVHSSRKDSSHCVPYFNLFERRFALASIKNANLKDILLDFSNLPNGMVDKKRSLNIYSIQQKHTLEVRIHHATR